MTTNIKPEKTKPNQKGGGKQKPAANPRRTLTGLLTLLLPATPEAT